MGCVDTPVSANAPSWLSTIVMHNEGMPLRIFRILASCGYKNAIDATSRIPVVAVQGYRPYGRRTGTPPLRILRGSLWSNTV